MRFKRKLLNKRIRILRAQIIQSTLFFADHLVDTAITLVDKVSLYAYNRYMRVQIGQMIEWTYNPKMDPLLGIVTGHSERGYIVHWNLGHKTKKSVISIYEMSEALMAGNYKLVLDKQD